MGRVEAFPLRVHEDADLSIVNFEDRLELKLTNKITGVFSEKPYYKLEKGIDVHEAVKIDIIVYHMHNDIGLDVWDSEKSE